MASVHPHGKGQRVHYVDANGKAAKSPTLPSPEAAAAWIREHLPAAGVTRLDQVLDLWAIDGGTDYRKRAGDSLAAVARTRGWVKVSDLTPGVLNTWLRDAKRAAAEADESRTRTSSIRYLLAALRWAAAEKGVAVRPEVLTYKPPRELRPPRRAKPPLLTDQQVLDIRRLAEGYGPRAASVVEYLLTYGARPTTACKLVRGDLDPVRLELHIEKAKHSGGWRHPVQRPHVAWRMLANWQDADDGAPLFPHYREDRAWQLDDDGSAKELCWWYQSTIAKRLKFPQELIGIYNLKRWAITNMLARGIEPATVANFTGHMQLSQVLVYTTTNEERGRAVLDRLGPPKEAIPKRIPKFPKSKAKDGKKPAK